MSSAHSGDSGGESLDAPHLAAGCLADAIAELKLEVPNESRVEPGGSPARVRRGGVLEKFAVLDKFNVLVENLVSSTCNAVSLEMQNELAEKLEPIMPIGQGGQGTVWYATHGDTRCAVKQIKKRWLTRNSCRKLASRPLTERACLAECGGHPFITTCFTAFQTPDSLFIAMELAPGGDLLELSERLGTGMIEADARFYFSCIALALRHLHVHGWLYRDVKLENVLIDEAGFAKLCDFGFAKKADSAPTQETTTTRRTSFSSRRVARIRAFTDCGTDEYAAPEQISGAGRGPGGPEGPT